MAGPVCDSRGADVKASPGRRANGRAVTGGRVEPKRRGLRHSGSRPPHRGAEMRTTILALAVMAGLAPWPAVADTEVRDLEDFDRVVFALPGKLRLTQGDDFAVAIEAEPEDLERIETDRQGDTLAIRWDSGLLGMWSGSPEGPIEVRITLPELRGLEVAGSGDVEAGAWLSESLVLEVNGSGSVHLASLAVESLTIDIAGSGDAEIDELDAAALRVEIAGSGNVELAGAADRQEIDVMGSGDVDADGLEGAVVQVDVMGSGDVSVWATEALSVDIMGSGDVRYRGNPRLERSAAGSGDVRPL
ncbi:MAG: hypothetical protein CMD39_02225 [Gammaproteobacteria bacterium]|nr:hypothetical protein [Gammaproteobacteria bacterium]